MRVKTTLLLLLALGFSIGASAQCNGATFEEQNGIAVIEAESVSLTSAWRKQSSFSGASGGSYINWTGTQYFGNPGNGTIQYKVKINSPGTYRFNWRTRIGIGSNSTEHNDTWVRFPDAADFYAQRGSSRIYPRGAGNTGPFPEGNSADGWFKVYMNSLNWSWSAFTSDFDGHVIYARFASAGVYTIQLSARSKGHLIDRMILYKENQYGAGSAQDLSRAETRCDGSTPPPPPSGGGDGGDGGGSGGANTAPSVSITSPSNGQNVAEGSNVSVQLSASDSDGSITQHRIFVNGALQDTDGSNFTPYVLTDIEAGAYTIRAVVTDNDGATAESSVSITVGGSSGGNTGGNTGGGTGGSGSNAAPTVSIASPGSGQNFATGTNISVNLSSNDSDGSVVVHEIFVNGNLVDTDPASFTPHIISNAPAGNYTVRAVVTDDDGATGDASVSFTVGGGGGDTGGGDTGGGSAGGDTSPTVIITSPDNGQNFASGTDVSVSLSTSDSDGSVVQHQIFVNGTLVDTDPAFFTPHIIQNPAAGTYVILAVVTDDDGNIGEALVEFTVGGGSSGGGATGGNNAPTVSITSPSDGQSFAAGSNVTVNLSSSDSDGSVIEKQIFVNGTLVDTDPGFLFTPYVIENVSAGNYTVRALVTDDEGATGEATVNFTVGSAKTTVETKAVAYPNPTSDGSLTVEFPRLMGKQIGYRLTSPTGQLVETGMLSNENRADSVMFKLPNLEQSQEGIYYLTVSDGMQSYVIPVIRK